MSSLTETNKWYLGNGVTKIIIDGTPVTQILVGGFPFSKWETWEADCQKNFSGCRWAKIISDHDKSQMFDLMIKEKFSVKAEQTKEPQEEGEILMGGERLER